MKTRVLVIDDSLTIRAILESILLKQDDFEIVGLVNDVEEAREALALRKPNVITLDLALPGLDGMSFLEELASQPHAPVVVLSSMTTKGSNQSKEALKLGAVACFDKAGLVQNAKRFVTVLRKAAERRKMTEAAEAAEAAVPEPANTDTAGDEALVQTA